MGGCKQAFNKDFTVNPRRTAFSGFCRQSPGLLPVTITSREPGRGKLDVPSWISIEDLRQRIECERCACYPKFPPLLPNDSNPPNGVSSQKTMDAVRRQAISRGRGTMRSEPTCILIHSSRGRSVCQGALLLTESSKSTDLSFNSR